MSTKSPICPFLKKPCIEHDCMLYTQLQWVHPQTGMTEQKYSCALAMIPVMLVENSRSTRSVASAVESSRNEMCERQDKFLSLVQGAATKRIEGD